MTHRHTHTQRLPALIVLAFDTIMPTFDTKWYRWGPVKRSVNLEI